MALTLFDDVGLREQIRRQKSASWALESIDWARGYDTEKFFLPLDKDALFFPNASPSQRRILSQYFGMVVNATIAEMEQVIHKVKGFAWERLLAEHPTQPELVELGEIFFDEEEKHSRMFSLSIDRFCECNGLSRSLLDRLLPQAAGSPFLRATIEDAKAGGSLFWWVVAAVEEVSVEIYRALHPHQAKIDPLYFQLHRKHFEEEARHRSYAFLMLDLYHANAKKKARGSWRAAFQRKLGWVRSQRHIVEWILPELMRVERVETIRSVHPFFEGLASCLPLLHGERKRSSLRRMLVTAPYLSYFVNPRYHRQTCQSAERHAIWNLLWPNPERSLLFAE
jgi:hypothetical protein